MKFGFGFDSMMWSGSSGNAYSLATLGSSGDVNSPLVGDVLFVETVYGSSSGTLQDYTNTVLTFKRNGTPITLQSGATQYIISQVDIGATLSVDVQIAEQDGTIQPTITQTLGGVVGGSGWSLGDLQDTFEGLYDMRESAYPKLQLYDLVDGIEVARVKNLLGNGQDFKPDQSGQNLKFYSANAGVGGTSGTQRGSLYKPTSNYSSDGVMFFRFYIPMGIPNTAIFPLRYFGASQEYWSYSANPVIYRIEVSGARADFSAQPGDTVVLLFRWSDTAFTTLDAQANKKFEVYTWSTYAGAPKYVHVNNASNLFAGATPVYGHGGTTPKFFPGLLPIHVMGWRPIFATDAEMNTLMTELQNL